jgi:hypothetical protein
MCLRGLRVFGVARPGARYARDPSLPHGCHQWVTLGAYSEGMEANTAVRREEGLGDLKMSSLQKLVVTSVLNNQPVKTIAGVSVGLVGCYIPFAASFCLARMAHLNAASIAGFEGVIAGAGIAACLMGIIAIYDSRNSLKNVAVIGGVLFSMVGLLVSLTV